MSDWIAEHGIQLPWQRASLGARRAAWAEEGMGEIAAVLEDGGEESALRV